MNETGNGTELQVLQVGGVLGAIGGTTDPAIGGSTDSDVGGTTKQSDEFDDAEYSEDITPLILAAQLERSDMIEILMKELPDIHPISRKLQ